MKLSEIYRDISPTILSQYKPADTEIVYNKDEFALKPNLHPITVEIPKLIRKIYESYNLDDPFEEHEKELLAGFYPEMWHTIEGFGKPAKEQKFKRVRLPNKLQDLQDTLTISKNETLLSIYKSIEKNPEFYKDEISFIHNCWHHRFFGKWYFINGKPVYFDPFGYFYFNFWTLDVGAPEYRDRSRRKFIFASYCYTTTEAYFLYRAKIDGRYRYSNEEGEYNEWKKVGYAPEKGQYLIDLGKRTCYGFNEPKHRRAGATFEAACINYVITTNGKNRKGALQSKDRDTAYDMWKQSYYEPILSLPFFFVPFNKNTKNSYYFRSAVSKQNLASTLWYAESAEESKLDGNKLYCYHSNEGAKMTDVNVVERHEIIKRCCQMGDGKVKIGLIINETTVAEMTKGGGANFLQLCKDSHWEKRMEDISGETKSGCFNLFLSGLDGLEGYIDEFGDSVIETPKTPVYDKDGKKIEYGAYEAVMKKRAIYKNNQTPEGQRAYNNLLRLTPIEFMDCFRANGSDSGFNVTILSDRLQELEFNDNLQPIRGDFEWKDPVKKDKAYFSPNPSKGRWFVSYLFPDDGLANRYVIRDNVYYPAFPKKFILSYDPFGFDKTKSSPSRLSNGGIAVFMCRDASIDKDDIPINEWETHRFVASYNYRASTKEEMIDDILKASIYYGAMMYPEHNVIAPTETIIKMGYGGYMLYDFDPFRKTFAKNPGFSGSGNSANSAKHQLFQEVKEHVEMHGARERHPDILKEILNIQGMEDMTNYDLFTAAGGCLLGYRSIYRDLVVGEEEEKDTDEYNKYFFTFNV